MEEIHEYANKLGKQGGKNPRVFFSDFSHILPAH